MYPETFPGITYGGVYVHEPGGLISDALIAILCLIFILIIGKTRDPFQKYWTLFIACIGVGGAGGVLVHGFPTVLGSDAFYWVWAIKNAFVAVANYCACFIVLALHFPRYRSTTRAFLVVKMIAVIVGLFTFYSFLPAVLDLGITYVIVLAYSNKLKFRNAAFKPIFLSFVIALISGPIYLIKYDIDPLWFSHKDMVHVFIFINLYLIFRAVKIAQKKYEPF